MGASWPQRPQSAGSRTIRPRRSSADGTHIGPPFSRAAARNRAASRTRLLARGLRAPYLLNELGNTLVVVSRDDDGRLDDVQSVSTLPADFSGDSDTAHFNGRHIYITNRGHDSVAVFDVQADDLSPWGIAWPAVAAGLGSPPSRATVTCSSPTICLTPLRCSDLTASACPTRSRRSPSTAQPSSPPSLMSLACRRAMFAPCNAASPLVTATLTSPSPGERPSPRGPAPVSKANNTGGRRDREQQPRQQRRIDRPSRFEIRRRPGVVPVDRLTELLARIDSSLTLSEHRDCQIK